MSNANFFELFPAFDGQSTVEQKEASFVPVEKAHKPETKHPSKTQGEAPKTQKHTQTLPGLHVDRETLAEGLLFAFCRMSEVPLTHQKGANDFLQACYQAWKEARGGTHGLGFEPMLEDLQSCAWTPSLESLVDGGMSCEGLASMPDGICRLEFPSAAHPLDVATKRLGRILSHFLSLSKEHRDEMFRAFGLITSALQNTLLVEARKPEANERSGKIKLIKKEKRKRKSTAHLLGSEVCPHCKFPVVSATMQGTGDKVLIQPGFDYVSLSPINGKQQQERLVLSRGKLVSRKCWNALPGSPGWEKAFTLHDCEVSPWE